MSAPLPLTADAEAAFRRVVIDKGYMDPPRFPRLVVNGRLVVLASPEELAP